MAKKKTVEKVEVAESIACVMTVDGVKHIELIGDPALSPKISMETDANECNYGLAVDPQYTRKMSCTGNYK